MESILTSVKKYLGISEDYTAFDDEIVMAINTAFFTLYQLGVGNDMTQPFKIADKTAVWSSFIDDRKIEMCKSYVCLRTKLLFDPPSTSFHVDAINAQIKEYECRMGYAVDEYNNYYEE